MFKRFFKGLAVGSVLGGSLALLLAPRSGKETRQKLVAEVDEVKDLTVDLTQSLQSFEQALGVLQETTSQLLPSFKSETKQALTNYQFKVTPRVKEINEQVELIKKHVQS